MNYVACEEDAIDDRLGIVGYLDDNFIAQMAVDLIEPAREPWMALLDETVGAWPFLNSLFIDDGTGSRPISEYMIINSALACADLRGGERGATVLILPLTGPVPFLLGFVSTLGLVQESGQRDVTEESFKYGQKVLVDNCAVAEFAGYDECNGRKVFKLRQYYTDRGERLKRDRVWPMSDLRRLLPVDSGRVPRGQINYQLDLSESILPALEYLFNSSHTPDLSAVTKLSILVMPVAIAHELGLTLSLYGQRLMDVVPMGHLGENGITSWSKRFGNQEPLLIVASDLDAACEFAEDRTEQINLVVVDLQGRNSNKGASLGRLQHLGIPTLIVSAERSVDEHVLSSGKGGIWEWSEGDFKSLLWPAKFNRRVKKVAPLVDYELCVQSRASCEILPIVIPNDLADRAFKSIGRVRALARARGDEGLVEMDKIVLLSYFVVSQEMRCAIPVTPTTEFFRKVELSLQEISTIRMSCNYLTEEERAAVLQAEDLMRQLFTSIQIDNPKARAIRELLAAHPKLTLLCPDAKMQSDLGNVYGEAGTNIVIGYNDDVYQTEGGIIPGWFRKEKMASLLLPPVTTPIHLVVYGLEYGWFTSFRREHKQAREARSAGAVRQLMFPNVRGWKTVGVEIAGPNQAGQEDMLGELDAIEQHVRAANRQQIYGSARSDGSEAELEARLIVFNSDTYAFLTESWNATVVTHLMDRDIDATDSKHEVKRKPVSQLKVGDALLFNRGSERDVIRAAADKLLAAGVRETSALWRKSLLEYSIREGFNTEQVHARLRDCGCPLHHLTIKLWLEDDQMIAPQAYARDVGLVAAVTGDHRLSSQMEKILSAIKNVRSAHLRASHQLAKQVVARALDILKAERLHESIIDLGGNVVIARIAAIDNQSAPVRASVVNRLMDGDVWHE